MNQQAPVNFAVTREALDSKGAPSQGRLHGALAHRLALDILRGTYAVGDILPYEHDAPEVMNTSRGPYREAIRILSAKGFVESRPRKGTQVCERTRWNLLDPEVLGWMLETLPSNSYIEGLFELRLINEPAAAEFAAERRTPEDIRNMRLSLDIMENSYVPADRRHAAVQTFHQTVLLAAQNEVLASLNAGIGAAIEWSHRLRPLNSVKTINDFTNHRRVFQAIERQDGRAARSSMETLIRLESEAIDRMKIQKAL